MAYVLGLVTYKDFAGVSRSLRTWVSDDAIPVLLPGGTLFDHLGNVLTLDIGSGVGALKTVAMTAQQVLGYDDHGAAITAGSNRPLPLGLRAVADLASLTPVTTTQMSWAHGTLDGRPVTVPWAHPGDWLPTTPVALTLVTDVPLVAAQAAGIRIALLGLAISNLHATIDTEVIIKDDTAEIARFPAPHLGGMAPVVLPFPLVGTAATVLNAALSVETGSANVTVTPWAYKTAVQ